MPRKGKLSVGLAALAILLTLPLCVGKTQARYFSETTYQTVLPGQLEPEAEEPSSDFLFPNGCTVLLNDWDVDGDVGTKSVQLPVDADHGILSAEVTEGEELVEAKVVDFDSGEVLLTLITEAVEGLRQSEMVTVHVTWTGEAGQHWVDFCVTLAVESKPETSIQAMMPVEDEQSETSSTLIPEYMDHFDPSAPLAMILNIPEGVDIVEILLYNKSETEALFPSRTQYCLNGKKYMLYEDAGQVKLAVTPGENSLYFDFSQIDEKLKPDSVFSMHLAGYANGEMQISQDITCHADVTLPKAPDAPQILSWNSPMKIQLNRDSWGNSKEKWETEFRLLTRQADGSLAYVPLENGSFRVYDGEDGCLCIVPNPQGQGAPPAGTYQMIIRLKLSVQTIYENSISFFVSYPLYGVDQDSREG